MHPKNKYNRKNQFGDTIITSKMHEIDKTGNNNSNIDTPKEIAIANDAAIRFQLALLSNDFGEINNTIDPENLALTEITNKNSKLFTTIAGLDNIIQANELQAYLQKTDAIPWGSKHPILKASGVIVTEVVGVIAAGALYQFYLKNIPN